ncbi:MAG: PIN domain-containing protein, partial [Armatimonadetes bacterium]|nr:PIN domain-containing protein [Armatimonadota bacterium]
MTKRLVLVDSSALIDFSRNAPSPIADAVQAVVEERRAAVCVVIAAEVLTGCRTAAEYRRMQLWLASVRWLPLTNECWSRAAALGFNLRRAGVTVPLTDRLVIVTARLHDAELLHHDAHFDLIG